MSALSIASSTPAFPNSPTMEYIHTLTSNTPHINSALKAFSPTTRSEMESTDDFFEDWCRNLGETNNSSSPDSASSPECPCPAPVRRPRRVAKRTSTRRKLLLESRNLPPSSPSILTPNRLNLFTLNLDASPAVSTPKRPNDSPLSSRAKFSKYISTQIPDSPTVFSSPVTHPPPMSPTHVPKSPNIQLPSPSQATTRKFDSDKDLLPTIQGKVADVKSISADTMADLLTGRLHTDAHVTIVDCRYPYEFDGGHINGAINLFTKDEVTKHFFSATNETTDQTHVIIFHCEFSSERGPKMYRQLRSHDRHVNAAHYPRLSYPNIYLLDSGYSAFYPQHKELCTGSGYTSMFDHAHKQDLKKFRVKSKSFPAPKLRSLDHGNVRATLQF